MANVDTPVDNLLETLGIRWTIKQETTGRGYRGPLSVPFCAAFATLIYPFCRKTLQLSISVGKLYTLPDRE